MVIWSIAKTTFGEAMRKKILNIFLIVAVAMIVLSVSFTQLGFQSDMTVVKSLGLLVVLLAGFIISLILCVSLIPNEVERRTIYTILSKPVNRYEFVVGKFLGGLLTLFVNIALMGAAFVIMVTIKAALTPEAMGVSAEVAGAIESKTGELVAVKPGIFDWSLVLGVIMIYFQFFLLSAVVMFFSIFLTPTVNFFASSAVYVVGSAASVWQSVYSSQNEKIPALIRGFYWLISKVVPNFDYYNISNRLIHPHHEVRSMVVYVAFVIGYALLFSTVLMIAAVLFFEKKEV